MLAEVGVLEQVKDLGRQALEVLVVLEDFEHAELLDLLSEALARLDENISLRARVHIVLQVNAILARHIHKHLNVVLVVRILLLVRMEQMLVLFEVADHFAIHSLVLQRAVQNDEHFRRDRPVVQVRDVTLKDELQCADRTHLVLVLAVQTLEQI